MPTDILAGYATLGDQSPDEALCDRQALRSLRNREESSGRHDSSFLAHGHTVSCADVLYDAIWYRAGMLWLNGLARKYFC